MPELPEVEIIRTQLEEKITEAEIEKAFFDPDFGNTLKFGQIREVEPIVKGKKITGVERRGKQLFINLNNDFCLSFHLKMTGRLLVRDKGFPKDEFLRFTAVLDSGKELRFTDREAFAWMGLLDKDEAAAVKDKFGPEPLEVSAEEFGKRIKESSKASVKETLLDQGVVAGVGNINADEALFVSKINPKRRAASLADSEIAELLRAVKFVLKKDLDNGGTTIDSFLDTDGKKGRNQDFLLIYGRENQKCVSCGNIVELIIIAGRKTYFCPVDQPEAQLSLF